MEQTTFPRRYIRRTCTGIKLIQAWINSPDMGYAAAVELPIHGFCLPNLASMGLFASAILHATRTSVCTTQATNSLGPWGNPISPTPLSPWRPTALPTSRWTRSDSNHMASLTLTSQNGRPCRSPYISDLSILRPPTRPLGTSDSTTTLCPNTSHWGGATELKCRL